MKVKQQDYKVSHIFLVQEEALQTGKELVFRYLDKNPLITYADMLVNDDEAINGTDDRFWSTVERGLGKNMDFASSMITVLQDEGVHTLDDLLKMQEGYLTKVLHTLTHLLDGFIGVDSVFYNMVEDSHRISEQLRKNIVKTPKQYWLIPVRTGMLEHSVISV
ncbi:hypothetical protein [Desulfogranum japonicum]|uniref:hypothetical protein n=1 Tax=Desulfogranum japonicum TaxID=231447 RepID=UPI00041A0A19|nr:hypothetical protein [Desulfogranum japonicum]